MRNIIAGLLVALLWYGPASLAQPIEGRDYTRVRPVQPTRQDKIEVIEFFSYQCPHCAAFAPSLDAWMRKPPADVAVKRESVSIGHEPWEPAAKTYYALQSLGKLEALDAAIFKAIHEQRARFADLAEIERWVAAGKVPAAEFRSAYQSFGVDAKTKHAESLSRNYQVPSIPAIAIDGKYLVAIAGNIDFQVQLANIDALIAKARTEKKASGPRK